MEKHKKPNRNPSFYLGKRKESSISHGKTQGTQQEPIILLGKAQGTQQEPTTLLGKTQGTLVGTHCFTWGNARSPPGAHHFTWKNTRNPTGTHHFTWKNTRNPTGTHHFTWKNKRNPTFHPLGNIIIISKSKRWREEKIATTMSTILQRLPEGCVACLSLAQKVKFIIGASLITIFLYVLFPGHSSSSKEATNETKENRISPC